MPSPQIDFYQITTDEPHWRLVCILLERAYKEGQRVYVHCSNQQQAEYLDELLWTFQDDSFIPHNLQGEGPQPPPPIQIGYQDYTRGFAVLMNLCAEIPGFYQRFQRVIEFVPFQEADKEQARLRYKQYRQQGCITSLHQT